VPDLQLENPNPHLLDRVMALADSKEVLAAEDIYTDKGIKLLSRGSQLDRAMQERLLSHKLKRPLVQSLSVAEQITGEALGLLAQILLEEQPMLVRLCAPYGVESLLADLAAAPLSKVSLLLLTLSQRTEGAAMRHAVMVSLIALSLGRSLRLSPDAMRQLAVAGLLHDIGELYIDPAVLAASHHVTQEEWRSLAVHPVVGHRLILETTDLGDMVARIVLEHHERIDGSGYPRGLLEAAISPAGQALAAAEMVVGLLGKVSDSGNRLDLALKVVSSGHAPPVMLKLRDSLVAESAMCGLPLYSSEGVIGALDRLVGNLDIIHNALIRSHDEATVAETRELVAGAVERFGVIRRAFLRTGLGSIPAAEIRTLLADTPAEELAEAMGIVDELNWRVRELSRAVSLRISMLPVDERNHLAPLLSTLADPLAHRVPA